MRHSLLALVGCAVALLLWPVRVNGQQPPPPTGFIGVSIVDPKTLTIDQDDSSGVMKVTGLTWAYTVTAKSSNAGDLTLSGETQLLASFLTATGGNVTVGLSTIQPYSGIAIVNGGTFTVSRMISLDDFNTALKYWATQETASADMQKLMKKVQDAINDQAAGKAGKLEPSDFDTLIGFGATTVTATDSLGVVASARDTDEFYNSHFEDSIVLQKEQKK